MKNSLIAFSVFIIFAAVLCYAETATVTTNAVTITAPTQYGAMYSVSIVNEGTNAVFFRPNVTTNNFSISNSIPVLPDIPYTATINQGKTAITGIMIASTNGTSNVAIGFGQ